MMPKIKTKEDYEIAKHERDIIEGMRINGTLSKAQLITLGIRNDAIAEYEENQKQMPDLSFFNSNHTELKEAYEWFKGLTFEQKDIYHRALNRLGKLINITQRAAESDPEAAQLLKDIANVNK